MRFTPLTIEERAATGGFTHRLDFSYQDIPAGLTANTANTFNAAPLPKLKANDIIKQCHAHVTQGFSQTGTPAYATTTVSVGLVTGGVAALIAAFEANSNGTVVVDTIPGVATPAVPVKNLTAGNQVTITLGAGGAGNSLSSLNRGQIYVLFSIQSASDQSVTKATPFIGGGYT